MVTYKSAKVWVLKSEDGDGSPNVRLFMGRQAGIDELIELIEYVDGPNGADSVKDEIEGDGDVEWQNENGDINISLYEQCTED